MTRSRQHHHVTITPQPDKIAEKRELLARCAELFAKFIAMVAVPPETTIRPVIAAVS